jgi:glutamine cyclotransferase
VIDAITALRRAAIAAPLALAAACANAGAAGTPAGDPLRTVPEFPWAMVERQPHDATLFTQGIAFAGDVLLESGGGYRESRIVMRRLADEHPLRTLELPRSWFAEGIAPHDGALFLLTWREGVAQSFSLPALDPLRAFSFAGEGWGLTSDGTRLIQSDGSDVLAWRDPRDFSVTARLSVRAGARPVPLLNELEWVRGWIVANVWLSDTVIGIDPHSGCVLWKLALPGLLEAREARRADVLNGVAWEEARGRLWVTGKLWPWLFALRVELPPVPADAALTGGACPG